MGTQCCCQWSGAYSERSRSGDFTKLPAGITWSPGRFGGHSLCFLLGLQFGIWNCCSYNTKPASQQCSVPQSGALLQLMLREYMPLNTEAAVLRTVRGGSQNWCQSRRLSFLSACPGPCHSWVHRLRFDGREKQVLAGLSLKCWSLGAPGRKHTVNHMYHRMGDRISLLCCHCEACISKQQSHARCLPSPLLAGSEKMLIGRDSIS